MTEKNKRISILTLLVSTLICLGVFTKYYAYEIGFGTYLLSALMFIIIMSFGYDYMVKTLEIVWLKKSD